MTENRELAGAAQPPERNTAPEVREVFPIMFEKDYKDFRGVEEVDDASVLAPKASSVLASVEQPKSVMGLEDVSAEDLATSALSNAAKAS